MKKGEMGKRKISAILKRFSFYPFTRFPFYPILRFTLSY